MLHNVVYATLCAMSGINGFYPGADLADSEAMFPEIYAKVAGVDDANLVEFETAFESLAQKSTAANAVADTNVPNATDLASAVTLVNELKATLNILKTNMRSSGILKAS